MAAPRRPTTAKRLRVAAALAAVLSPLAVGQPQHLSGDVRASLRGCHGASCSEQDSSATGRDAGAVAALANEAFLQGLREASLNVSLNSAAGAPGADDVSPPRVDAVDDEDAPARRLKGTYYIAFTVSKTGPKAFPPDVTWLLYRTIESIHQRADSTGMPRDMSVNITDDESNVTKVVEIYTAWCTGFPMIDVLFGPARFHYNVDAVRVAQLYGVPIIVWSFEDVWYLTGYGYHNPEYWVEDPDALKDDVGEHEATAFATYILDLVARGPMETHPDSFYPDAVALPNGKQCVGDRISHIVGFLNGGDLDPIDVTYEELPSSMLALELSGFEGITGAMAENLSKSYTTMLGSTKSYMRWHLDFGVALMREPCFRYVLDEPYWNIGYDSLYDLNTPHAELLRRTLKQLYSEGKQSIAFIAEAGMSRQRLQTYLGGLAIAKELDFTDAYSIHYTASHHAWTFRSIELLKVDVLVACGTDRFMELIISEVNARTWSYSPLSLVLATPRLLTLNGLSIARLDTSPVVNQFIQPLPWGALEPAATVMLYTNVGEFLDAVVPNETTLEQVRAWQLAAAYTVAFYVNVNRETRPNNESFRAQICSASENYGIASELGTLFFNCTTGYTGKREHAPSAVRQLRALPADSDRGSSWAAFRMIASMATYIGRADDTYIPLAPGANPWWKDYLDWYRPQSDSLDTFDKKRYEVWACEPGYESKGKCWPCEPGSYFDRQWLRCRYCTDTQFTIEPASMYCHEVPVTDPHGGAVFDTPQTVPLAAPGWYRISGPDEEDATFFQCPQPEFCVGNNTCYGDVVGVLCASCKPGFQRWENGDVFRLLSASTDDHEFCHQCHYSIGMTRFFILLVIWIFLTCLLSRWARLDTYKVGSIRFANLRMFLFNLQLAMLTLGQVTDKNLLPFIVSSIVVSPWEASSLECFASLVWPGGTQAEWREYVLESKIWCSVCLTLGGVVIIWFLNVANVLAKIPQELLRTSGVCGPLRLFIFAILGEHLGCFTPWVEAKVAKAWARADSETFGPNESHDSDGTDSTAYSLPSHSLAEAGFELESTGGDADHWPGMPRADQDPTLRGSSGMHCILNHRSRIMDDCQRQVSSYLFLMYPIVLNAVINRFACTMSYGEEFRTMLELDLTCVASFDTIHKSSKKWLLLLSIAIPMYQLLPLLSMWRLRGQGIGLHITNRRGLAVVVLGYDLKHTMWQVWEYFRMWWYVLLCYNLSDAIVVVPRRLAWALINVTFFLLFRPYTSSHKDALNQLDALWYFFHSMHLVTDNDNSSATVMVFPSEYVSGKVLVAFIYGLALLLVLGHGWITLITTWDPNRYNIDNLRFGGAATMWSEMYVWLFTHLTGVEPITVGMGIGRINRYVDLRRLRNRQIEYFARILGDAIVRSMEYQPNFSPSILYVIMEEAFRRAVASREALIETRAIRRFLGHWQGPYNLDYGFVISWQPDRDLMDKEMTEGILEVQRRVVKDNLVQEEELMEYLVTHLVMRDNAGHIIEDDIVNVSRHMFPVHVLLETNRSIAVEELATALSDVCVDIYGGEPSLCSNINTLTRRTDQNIEEAYDDILAALTETKEEQKKEEEENKQKRLGVLHLIMAACGSGGEDATAPSLADALHPAQLFNALEEATMAATGPRTRSTMTKMKAFVSAIPYNDTMSLEGGARMKTAAPGAAEDYTDDMVQDLAHALDVTMPEASFVLGTMYAVRKSNDRLGSGTDLGETDKSKEMRRAKTSVFERVEAKKTMKVNAVRHTLRVKLLELDMLISEGNSRGLKGDDRDEIRLCTELVNSIEAKHEREAYQRKEKSSYTLDRFADPPASGSGATPTRKTFEALPTDNVTPSRLSRGFSEFCLVPARTESNLLDSRTASSSTLTASEQRLAEGWGRVAATPLPAVQRHDGKQVSSFWRSVLKETFRESDEGPDDAGGAARRQDDGISVVREDTEMDASDSGSSSSRDPGVAAGTMPAPAQYGKPGSTASGGNGHSTAASDVDVDVDGSSGGSEHTNHLASAIVAAPPREDTMRSIGTAQSSVLDAEALNLPPTMFVYVGEEGQGSDLQRQLG